MVSVVVVFVLFMILFGVIGGMRGMRKEVLVTSALVLGLFLNVLLETFVPPWVDLLNAMPRRTQFLIRGGILLALALFGYETPTIRAIQERAVRERVEQILLGVLFGLLNGYLLVGSLWFYLHELNYLQPEVGIIAWPPQDPEMLEQIVTMVSYMPPAVLGVPLIYFTVAAMFVMVIVVFI